MVYQIKNGELEKVVWRSLQLALYSIASCQQFAKNLFNHLVTQIENFCSIIFLQKLLRGNLKETSLYGRMNYEVLLKL